MVPADTAATMDLTEALNIIKLAMKRVAHCCNLPDMLQMHYCEVTK